jgi:hypothetical protein
MVGSLPTSASRSWWSSGVALATMESEWIVHGRPSTSETLAPASAASSPPAAAWMADVQKRTYAATRPDAT